MNALHWVRRSSALQVMGRRALGVCSYTRSSTAAVSREQSLRLRRLAYQAMLTFSHGYCWRGIAEVLKYQHRTQTPFHSAVILLDDIDRLATFDLDLLKGALT